MDPGQQILGLCKLSSIAFFFFFHRIANLKERFKYFSDNSSGKILLLFISGIYVSISLLDLLPYSEKQLHLAKISHKFMANYLVVTLSFGVAMLIDKIFGYDHEEQIDNMKDETYSEQELEFQFKNAHNNKKDIEMHLMQIDISQLGSTSCIQDPEILKKDLDKLNFIFIYFYVFLIGFALGGTLTIQYFIIEFLCTGMIIYFLACRLGAKFNEQKFPTLDIMSCVKLLLVLTSIGIITGIIVSLYSSHIILSYSASINSGNLLYIGTMKLIVKNYDTSGNKYIYFFAFFLGFVIMSAGIYEDVFS